MTINLRLNEFRNYITQLALVETIIVQVIEFHLKLAFLEKCKLVKTNESSGRVFFISNSFAQKRTLVMWFR